MTRSLNMSRSLNKSRSLNMSRSLNESRSLNKSKTIETSHSFWGPAMNCNELTVNAINELTHGFLRGPRCPQDNWKCPQEVLSPQRQSILPVPPRDPGIVTTKINVIMKKGQEQFCIDAPTQIIIYRMVDKLRRRYLKIITYIKLYITEGMMPPR